MKFSRQFLHPALAALALAGLIISRALWLAPVTMLWSATARGQPIPLPRLAPYQQFTYTYSCESGYCYINFPAVSAETLISLVTCTVTVPNSSGISTAYLWNADENDVEDSFLPVITYSTYGGNTYYAINTQTGLFLSSGQTPQVFLSNNAGTISYLACSVSGYSGPALLPATAQPSAAPLPSTPAGLPSSPGLPMVTRVPAQ